MRSRLAEARYFLRYLKPVRRFVLLVVVCSLLASMARLPFTYIPKVFGDALEQSSFPGGLNRSQFMFAYLAFALGVSLVSFLLMLLRGYCASRIGEYQLRAIRTDLFAKLEKLSMLSVYSRGAGQFVQRLARDVYYIRDLFNDTLTTLFSETLRASVYVVAMFTLEPTLTVVLLSLFGVVIPFVHWINRKVEVLARRTQILGEDILAQLIEAISGFRDILASGRFDRFAHRFEAIAKDAERVSVRTSLWGQAGGLLPGAVISVLLVAPYFLAVHDLTPERLGAIITYVMLLADVLPIGSMFARATSDLALATPSLREVRKVLESEEMAEGKMAPAAARPGGRPPSGARAGKQRPSRSAPSNPFASTTLASRWAAGRSSTT